MYLRSVSRKRVSVKSTILALGVTLLVLAPATLHASSYLFDFSLNPTSCSGTGCVDYSGSGSATFSLQPTVTYTNYSSDVTALTFTMSDGTVFSLADTGASLSFFGFSQLTPTDIIWDITFADSIGTSDRLTLDTTGGYVYYYDNGLDSTTGTFGTGTLTSATSSATPEPSSFLLLGTGLLTAVGTLARRYQLQRV